MRVLMISPGFPGEMPFFARGLAAQGAKAHEILVVTTRERDARQADVFFVDRIGDV